jgi:hypothetical protein
VICPACRVEFGPTWERCPYCGATLVEGPPTEPTHGRREGREATHVESHGTPTEQFSLVTVFTTSDWGLMAIARSILASAEIPVLDQHSRSCSSLCVAPMDADDARALLADLIADAEGSNGAHS